MLPKRFAFAGWIACVTAVSAATTREQIRARRDDGATADGALGVVEIFGVVRR
jgi:hypothetical protein